jgi:hypothetical protein
MTERQEPTKPRTSAAISSCSRVQCEMTGGENVDLRARYNLAVASGSPGRTRGYTYPRSPACSAASRASMPATSGRPPRWFDSRLCRLTQQGELVRPQIGDVANRGSDRFRHGGYASRLATEDSCGARCRWQRERPKRPASASNSRPGLRCARQRRTFVDLPSILDLQFIQSSAIICNHLDSRQAY